LFRDVYYSIIDSLVRRKFSRFGSSREECFLKVASGKTAHGLLLKYNLRTKKRFGQNFLIDENIIKKIVRQGNLNSEETVVEIGPGLGAMTQHLGVQAGKVICLELDRDLIPVLKETLAEYNGIEIKQGDALNTNLDLLVNELKGSFPYKVIANLPYYITTPLIMHFLESGFNISKMVLMVQKEVAQRMAAQPNTSDYGALTVAVQFYCQCNIAFYVPPSVFLPKPAVESAVVELIPLDKPRVAVEDEKLFFQVVRAAFNKRRKTLVNALANSPMAFDKALVSGILSGMQVNEKIRGEALSIEQFAHIAKEIKEAGMVQDF